MHIRDESPPHRPPPSPHLLSKPALPLDMPPARRGEGTRCHPTSLCRCSRQWRPPWPPSQGHRLHLWSLLQGGAEATIRHWLWIETTTNLQPPTPPQTPLPWWPIQASELSKLNKKPERPLWRQSVSPLKAKQILQGHFPLPNLQVMGHGGLY